MIVETLQTLKDGVGQLITFTKTGYEVRTNLDEVRKRFHVYRNINEGVLW